MIKLLMGWNIIPGSENAYFDYFVEEFQPGMSRLGLQTTDVWYTTYGNWPQIITGVVSKDLESMRQVLRSEEWKRLKRGLFQFVTDYRQKIIQATGGYQL